MLKVFAVRTDPSAALHREPDPDYLVVIGNSCADIAVAWVLNLAASIPHLGKVSSSLEDFICTKTDGMLPVPYILMPWTSSIQCLSRVDTRNSHENVFWTLELEMCHVSERPACISSFPWQSVMSKIRRIHRDSPKLPEVDIFGFWMNFGLKRLKGRDGTVFLSWGSHTKSNPCQTLLPESGPRESQRPQRILLIIVDNCWD